MVFSGYHQTPPGRCHRVSRLGAVLTLWLSGFILLATVSSNYGGRTMLQVGKQATYHPTILTVTADPLHQNGMMLLSFPCLSKNLHNQNRYDDKARRRAAAQAKSEADYELRHARERDSHHGTSGRERRKSFSASAAAAQSSVQFPDNPNTAPYASHPSLNSYGTSPYTIVNTAALGGQPSTTSSSHYRSTSASYDLARQMEDLDIESSRKDYVRHRRVSGKSSSRRQSLHESTMNGSHGYPQISSYHTSPNMQPATMPYGTAGSNGYPSSAAYGVTGPQVYPPGHVLEGHPIAGSVGSVSKSRPSSRHASRPPSRAPSPNRSKLFLRHPHVICSQKYR